MKRLTRYDANGELIILEEERILNANGLITKDEMYKIMRYLAEKLAEYENAEENGTLKMLPCKIGDTIYFIGKKCNICEEDDCYGCPYNRNGEKKNEKFVYPMTVEQFRIRNNKIYLVDTDAVWASNENSFCIDELGETVFLKEEEANAKKDELNKKGGLE